MKSKHESLIAISIVSLLLVGGILTYVPVLEKQEFKASSSMGGIQYSFDCNVPSYTHAVVMAGCEKYDFETILFLRDTGYQTSIDPKDLNALYDDLTLLCKRYGSISELAVDVSEMLEKIDSSDVKKVGLLFATGYYPKPLYDGTDQSPIVEWLDRGGAIINIGGPFGKYVSDSSGVTAVEGYGELFLHAPDSVFNDPSERVFTTNRQAQSVENALGVHFTEYTYGINISALSEYSVVGNVSEEGFASAVYLKIRNGELVNIGAVAGDYREYEYFVAQLISSGWSHSAEIVECHTYGASKSNSGDFPLEPGNYRIYGWVGSLYPVYGKYYDLTVV